jgi:hypothetical protein
MFNRAAVVDRAFVQFCREAAVPGRPRDLEEPISSDIALTGRDLLELLESQMTSRLLDITSR